MDTFKQHSKHNPLRAPAPGHGSLIEGQVRVYTWVGVRALELLVRVEREERVEREVRKDRRGRGGWRGR